MTYTDKN